RKSPGSGCKNHQTASASSPAKTPSHHHRRSLNTADSLGTNGLHARVSDQLHASRSALEGRIDVGHSVIANIHVPPDGLADAISDEGNAAGGEGDVDTAGVSAASLRLLEGTGLPRPHATLGVIDTALNVIGIVIHVVGVGAVPRVIATGDAGARHSHGPGAARVAGAQVAAGADFVQQDGGSGAVLIGQLSERGAEVDAHD